MAGRLLLGVTGGIAAYKAAEIASGARKSGWEVRVTMTPDATRFIGAVTFEALTGHRVLLDTFTHDGAIDHIAWARWPTVALVAPCTAHTLARLALGLADDALASTWLALNPNVRRVIAPAMNPSMWAHPAVQAHAATLKSWGMVFVEPVDKVVACGESGVGGLADVEHILDVALAH